MKVATLFRLCAAVGIALAIVIGCNSLVSDVVEESLVATDGFATLDSVFTDEPISPGGTGGVGTPGTPEGSDDVDLPAEETRSFFTALQIDPTSEDTAGPKFVVSADIDQDGLLDLVSGWNQSQPIQLHLQRRDPTGLISFRTINLGGTTPIAIIAGVEVGQINDDGWLDVVVLAKASGRVGLCPTSPPSVISNLEGEIVVLFSPGSAAQVPDGDAWTEMILVNPFVQDRWIHNQFPGIESVSIDEAKTKPERAGYTALAVGDLDGVQGDEIIVALNPGECKELGQEPPIDTVDVWINPGGALSETSEEWGVPSDIGLSRPVPMAIMLDAPEVTDITLSDVDGDGDRDVVAAWSNSLSLNVRWARNPLIPSGRAAVISGGSDGGADFCEGGTDDGDPCPNGNADCTGVPDGTCGGGGTCSGGLSPGAACADDADCEGVADGVCTSSAWRYIADQWENRPVGQVDTNAFAIAVGDIDTDGFDDVLVRSTPGQIVQWFRKPNPQSIAPEFPPNDTVPSRFNFPWPVFTLTEFSGQEPEAIAIGEVTGDGQVEVMVAVEGGVYWFDGTIGASVYDPWFSNTIIQDGPADTTEPTTAPTTGAADPNADPDATSQPGGTGVGVTEVDTSTHINTLLVVDLDGDGRQDIIGTLDRRTGAGLSDDRLVWYRNTREEE